MTFRRNGTKYGNSKCHADGFTFDSSGERDRYWILKAAQERGDISDLEVKPGYPLELNGVKLTDRPFHPDFRYKTRSGTVVVEDYKGRMSGDPNDQLFKLKCRLVEAIYGQTVTVVQTEATIRSQERQKAAKKEKARLQRLAKKLEKKTA